jgi:hypothetical protein
MTTNTTKKTAGAINTNGLNTDTNKAHFRTGDAIEQAQEGKAIATQIAHLTIAGHAVHQIAVGCFLVCKYGMTHRAEDFAALQAFARKLGVKQ